MTDRLKLVQGDTRPPLIVSLADVDGAIDLSDVGTTIRLKFRAEGTTSLLATIIGGKLTGVLDDDGSVITTSPYDIPGRGGRAQFDWALVPSALAGAPGNYEAEIEITFPDNSVQTVYDLLKFRLRSQL